MLKYKQGDLLKAFEEGEVNVLLHQENCEGLGYFAGFAKALHKKYPDLTKLQQEYCKKDVFGTICVYDLKDNKYIVNLYAQKYRGSPNNSNDTIALRFEALRQCLKEVSKQVKNESFEIGLPLIASGLAASKQLKGTMTDLEYFKKYVAPIVEEGLKDLDVTIYYL